MTLRALDPAGDRPWLEALWAAALGGSWPPLPAGLDLIRAGVVAEERGAAVGMVAVDPAGSILLLLVDPAHQRCGVGTRLLDAALRRLGDLGAGAVQQRRVAIDPFGSVEDQQVGQHMGDQVGHRRQVPDTQQETCMQRAEPAA